MQVTEQLQSATHVGQLPDPTESPIPDRFGLPIGLYLGALWKARSLFASVVVICLLVAAGTIVLLGHKYRAEATISPVTSQNLSINGTLGLLSAAAGANLGGLNSGNFEKYKALLQSTRLAADLAQKRGALQIVFSRSWDSENKTWRRPTPIVSVIRDVLGVPWSPPTEVDLAKWLSSNFSLESSANGADGLAALRSQIYAVSLKFKNKQQAVELLTFILNDADDIARHDQLANTSNRVVYLQNAIKKTTDVNLLESLRNLLLDQERTLMTLKTDKFYSFDLIDPPDEAPPSGLAMPIKVLLIAIVFGIALYAAIVFLLLRGRIDRAQQTKADPLAQPFPNPIGIFHSLLVSRRKGNSAR